MQVTSIEQLKKIKMGEVVELPSFDDGTPFIAELKKPSIIAMMAGGKFPNTLMPIVMDMFRHGKGQEVINKALDNGEDFKVLLQMLEVLARECLINPSYSQLKEIGIELNENQLSAILQYTQGGLKALENFRKQQEHN